MPVHDSLLPYVSRPGNEVFGFFVCDIGSLPRTHFRTRNRGLSAATAPNTRVVFECNSDQEIAPDDEDDGDEGGDDDDGNDDDDDDDGGDDDDEYEDADDDDDDADAGDNNDLDIDVDVDVDVDVGATMVHRGATMPSYNSLSS